MILTSSLEYKDLVNKLDKDKDVITIIGCNTCVRVSGSGGPVKMKELALRLRKDGFNVRDGIILPYACMEPYLATVKIPHQINTIIALVCTAGASNIRRNYPNHKVVETVESIGLIITDTNKDVIKLAMPYEKYKDRLGHEYLIGSDAKNKLDHEQIPVELEVQR